jgi:23S rRNA pseudouridine1911/1915/1917 synthase|tara:strand:+ start:127532 stop:128488 length:957 start_codon:yes stop_codon:yes gene_type:complete
MSEQITHSFIIPDDHHGWRLDRSLTELLGKYSRSRVQTWINQDQVQVDGANQPCKFSLKGGESVYLVITAESVNEQHQAENIPLDIVFEDEHLLVVNKPVGLVVHPGAGIAKGTLLNALLYHSEVLAEIPRAGIVHRLDKDTTGLMVVAKSLVAHAELVKSLQEHVVQRRYYAVLRGQVISGGKIDQPIGRHPHDRIKMAVNPRGKDAITHYKVVEKYQKHTLIEASLETGRTHQIRVHFASLNYPLVGDTTYARRIQRVSGVAPELNEVLANFPRQALHAHSLSFKHPVTSEEVKWAVPMPDDLQALVTALRTYSAQ